MEKRHQVSNMRITGGHARSIRLVTPKDVAYLRPATDYMRESVFSSLGALVKRAFVLDLFAGVGSYGLEAVSRGAQACVFVEKNRQATDALKTNIKNITKAIPHSFESKIFCHDVFVWAETCSVAFDIIFIDPPYNIVETRGDELLEMFAKLLKPSTHARLLLEVPGAYHPREIDSVREIKRLGRTGNTRQPNVLIYEKQ